VVEGSSDYDKQKWNHYWERVLDGTSRCSLKQKMQVFQILLSLLRDKPGDNKIISCKSGLKFMHFVQIAFQSCCMLQC
jgi:hypothetical protein